MMKFNLDSGGDGALFRSILPLPYSTRFFEKYKACLSRRRSLVSLEARSVCGANLACLGCFARGVSYVRLFSSDGILRRSALAGERRCVSHDSRSGGGRGEFLSQLLSWDEGWDKLSQSS